MIHYYIVGLVALCTLALIASFYRRWTIRYRMALAKGHSWIDFPEEIYMVVPLLIVLLIYGGIMIYQETPHPCPTLRCPTRAEMLRQIAKELEHAHEKTAPTPGNQNNPIITPDSLR